MASLDWLSAEKKKSKTMTNILTEEASIVGTKWVPKSGQFNNLHWKVTDYFTSVYGRTAVQIEKYQGGRNSPAIITIKRLKKNFTPCTPHQTHLSKKYSSPTASQTRRSLSTSG